MFEGLHYSVFTLKRYTCVETTDTRFSTILDEKNLQA